MKKPQQVVEEHCLFFLAAEDVHWISLYVHYDSEIQAYIENYTHLSSLHLQSLFWIYSENYIYTYIHMG